MTVTTRLSATFARKGAVLFLGEKMGLNRMIGVIAALVGAMIVILPGLGVFSPTALLPIACAFYYASNMLLTRLVGSRESPWASMIYASLSGIVLCSLVLPFYWQPIAWWDVPMFLLSGALVQRFIIRAFSVAKAGVLAPFGYLDIIFATAWSIFAFGDYPDRFTILGALVIIAAGLYGWRQETLGANPKPVV